MAYSTIAALSLCMAAVFTLPAFADGGVQALGKSIRNSELDAQRGGQETQVINEMMVNGTLTNNTATNNLTGNNSITTNAFSGASGFPMVIQNTGNNVLIQNATIINLEMH